MTFGGFILGLIIFAAGFMMVWRTNWFVENWGDIGQLIGINNAMWASWKLFGIFLILLGFLVAFGLLQLFFWATIGGLFSFGGLE